MSLPPPRGGLSRKTVREMISRALRRNTCCSPTLVPSWNEVPATGIYGLQPITIPQGLLDTPISTPAWCVEEGATARFALPLGFGPAVLPIVNSVTVQPAGDPAEAPTIIINISAPVGTTPSDSYHLLVQNPCGCCGLWPGPIIVQP